MTGLIMSIFFVMVTMFPASANISVYAEVSGEMITMADIDPETVSIPRYDKISSEWLDDSGRDRYKKVEWYSDGISGYIYRDKDGDIYFKYGGGAAVYYRTEKDAIEALYVEKKYDKLRKTGRISK
ncbi:MAG: hypothetical protein LBF04_02990 [Prevotellaceae bacterium]|nr:hypothetical protein [Prevotellaceae bacterium]